MARWRGALSPRGIDTRRCRASGPKEKVGITAGELRIACGECATPRFSVAALLACDEPGLTCVFAEKHREPSVDRVSKYIDFVVYPDDGVPEAFGVGVGEEEDPGLAGVGGFVEARERAFAAGHDDGGGGVEGLDAAEVEVVGVGRGGAALPVFAVVGGAEDGAFGAGGPGDVVAKGVDAAEVSGGGGGLDLPLGLGRGGNEESGEDKGRTHLVEVYARDSRARWRELPQGLKPLCFLGGSRAKPEGLAYLEARVKRRVRAAYVPPKQSLDGAPAYLEARANRAVMRAAYIPPKQSLDGAPVRLGWVSEGWSSFAR